MSFESELFPCPNYVGQGLEDRVYCVQGNANHDGTCCGDRTPAEYLALYRRAVEELARRSIKEVEPTDDGEQCECELDWRCGLHASRFTPIEEINDRLAAEQGEIDRQNGHG